MHVGSGSVGEDHASPLLEVGAEILGIEEPELGLDVRSDTHDVLDVKACLHTCLLLVLVSNKLGDLVVTSLFCVWFVFAFGLCLCFVCCVMDKCFQQSATTTLVWFVFCCFVLCVV